VPASLDLANHVAILRASGAALADRAEAAGLAAAVPTCPAWTTAQLLAHQGMVHRWAAAHLRGDDLSKVPKQTEVARTEPDLLGWYRRGLAELLEVLEDAPEDAKAMVFLRDAPRPREFWARRQAHETTIHAVDALAAALGRVPDTADVGIDTATAVDGIDELVCGFMPRGKKSSLADAAPCTIVIEPVDSPAAWTLTVSEGPLRAETGQTRDADVRFAGTAAELYLGLWNRGTAFTAEGRTDIVPLWRHHQRVAW
jgi:uncharacterized protein (TIGR03083 family)